MENRFLLRNLRFYARHSGDRICPRNPSSIAIEEGFLTSQTPFEMTPSKHEAQKMSARRHLSGAPTHPARHSEGGV
ncbi:MAG: hypothetical protein WBR26_12690, partial [Candidatus Acidiferrum sp.]